MYDTSYLVPYPQPTPTLTEIPVQTITLLPCKWSHEPSRHLDLDLDTKLAFMRQELQTNIVNSIKAIFAGSEASISSKPAPNDLFVSEILKKSVQNSSQTQLELSRINQHLGR